VTALFILIACVELAFCVVIYRADPQRWDNRIFAFMGTIDAAMSIVRALYQLGGVSVAEWAVGQVCACLSVVLAFLTLEFAWSFPFSRPQPMWSRIPAAIFSAAAFALLLSPWSLAFAEIVTEVFFLPMLLATIWRLAANLRQVQGSQARPVKLIMAALLMRWGFAMFAYGVAQHISPRAFTIALMVDVTVGVIAAAVLMGYAVLIGQLFRVRGLVAEIVVHTTFALAVVMATLGAIEASLALAPGEASLRLLLVASALVPIALVAGIRRLRARIEAKILAPLDPRRAKRAGVVERVLHAGGRADVVEAIGEVSGGEVELVAAPGRKVPGAKGELEPELAAKLSESAHVHGEGVMHVAVRAGGELLGALALRGGQLDRDTLLTAEALGAHLAILLENRALVTELEESRRLATLGAFAAAIAHDIRTPLASVQMNVQILRGRVNLPPDDMEHFDIAQEELTRLNAHIAELLDYAKPVRLESQELELREVADDAARGIAPVLAEKGVSLSVEVPEDLPVRGDAHRLRQVFLNLLDNAAKASTPGSEVTLRGARAAGGLVSLEVADRGKGIERADLERIFEPFYTTRPDGTGLGLAIVRKLVRAHRGEVQVRSAPGQGATFTVLLPAE
jgi:signal transduction histidine kinase